MPQIVGADREAEVDGGSADEQIRGGDRPALGAASGVDLPGDSRHPKRNGANGNAGQNLFHKLLPLRAHIRGESPPHPVNQFRGSHHGDDDLLVSEAVASVLQYFEYSYAPPLALDKDGGVEDYSQAGGSRGVLP